MDWIQFFIIVGLLAWIIRRSPSRLEQEVFTRRLFQQLNQIESAASGVPVEGVEEKWFDYAAALVARHKGAPLRARIGL